MFVAPPEKEVEWTDTGLEGSFRFLARVWRIADQWRDEAARPEPARSITPPLTGAERACGARRTTPSGASRSTSTCASR